MSKLTNSLAIFGIIGTAVIVTTVALIDGGTNIVEPKCKTGEETLFTQTDHGEILCLSQGQYAELKQKLKEELDKEEFDINAFFILPAVLNNEIKKNGLQMQSFSKEKLKDEIKKLLK